MNKTKKALASLAIAGMVLSMAPVSVFAAETETRLAGADRYLTSIKIAEKAYASADTAVVAAGNPNNLVDALAAAPLAAQEDAPIYLTDKADMNDDVVKSMKALGVDKVIVVGAAASKAVVDELKAAGFSVEEVKGAGRVETAEAINKKLTAPAGTFVVGYDGVADAMSVASYAAANNYAIVVTNQNGTPNGTVEADYIVGGTTRVKDIAGAKRLAGADRYDTNKQVIAELDFDFGTVYVGNGLTLADALVGSVLAAQTDSPIALTDGKTVKADIASNLTDDSVIVALGGTAAVSNAVIDAVKNPPSTGEFKVESVTAKAANAFQVKFGKAPADASKVTFEVKRNSTPVTVSATWDGAVATLTSSQKFPEGDYTVAVKEGEKDLGSSTVKITAQKIAKIEITSTKLGVASVTTGFGMGYATYKVEDQYGNDITTESMANSLTFQSGVGDVQGRDGILKVTPNINILQFSTVVITGYDSNSGVSVSASLSVSTQVGTLSDIKLNELTNADKKELTAGDTSTLFYATYTATDISGNTTNDLNMVKEGLILNSSDELQTSSPYVKAKVVADPANSKKAAIQVWVNDATPISVDMPVVITAMTYTGKTSQLNATLKKAAAVDTFTLMTPAYDVAVGDGFKEIPFVAYDQNGVQLKKATDFANVTFSDNLDPQVNVDGTLKLMLKNQTAHGNQVLTAMTPTGKYSSVTINIQKPAVADSLAVDTAALKTIMQSTVNSGTADAPVYTDEVSAAEQKVDFGYGSGGLEIKDQYGRVIDMTTVDSTKAKYTVTADSSDNTIVKAANTATIGQNFISLKALKPGTATITFELFNSDTTKPDGTPRDNTVPVDTKTVTFTVVKDADIKGYVIDEVAKPIYATNTTGSAITAYDTDYKANPKVYGTTSSGTKVVLRGAPIIGASVDSDDFVVFTGGSSDAAAYDGTSAKKYNAIKVVAKKLTDSNKTGAETTLAVTVRGADGKVYGLSTVIKSSTEAPKAVDVDVVADTSVAGISKSGDTIKLNAAAGGSYAAMLGTTLAKYDASGNESNVYIAPTDQYGKTGSTLAQFVLVDNGGTTFDISPDGTINLGNVTANKSVTISGVTKNGLVKTIKIVFE